MNASTSLNPDHFRALNQDCQPIIITRANIDALLDSGSIEAALRNGKWWRIRRNGSTRRWKRDASRIAIPFKAGLYVYGTITETDFQS